MKRHVACLCNPGTRCMNDCVPELPPHMKIVCDLEKCGSHIDVERIEATLAKLRAWERNDAAWSAKFRAAEQDDAAWLALYVETMETARALQEVAAGRLRDWRDPPAVHNKRRAAVLRREVKALAAKLKRSGHGKPVERAEEIVAARCRFPNRAAFNRWVRNKLRRKP